MSIACQMQISGDIDTVLKAVVEIGCQLRFSTVLVNFNQFIVLTSYLEVKIVQG